VALIRHLLPASLTAGPAASFTLKVRGDNFAAPPAAPPFSFIRFDGAALATDCTDLGATASPRFECTATVDPSLANSPLQNPGNVTLQVENPAGSAAPGLSNPVSLVVVAPDTTEGVIRLTTNDPLNPKDATGQDIIVVEPTTAATVPADQVNVTQIGFASGVNCSPRGSPIAINRPASGQQQDFQLCLVSSSGFTQGSTITISGPNPNDITLPNGNTTPAGLVAVFTIRVLSTSQTGPRTFFVENPQKEKSALVGAVEIK
jgi:hypothetical protein